MELIKFDLILSDVVENEKILSGGDREDKDHLLRYLNNYKNKYLKSVNSSDGNNYIFEVLQDDEKNRLIYKDNYDKIEQPYTSKYIGAGFYSTAIAIKMIQPFDKKIIYPEILVFKSLGVKKNKDEKFYRGWNDNFYGNYKKDANEFGNLMLEIYFYGDNVINEKYLEEVDVHNSNYNKYFNFLNDKKICFSISKYHYNQIYLPLNYKKIFIIKISAILDYLSKKFAFINDFKNDNISCDIQNFNVKCIDIGNDTINHIKINDNYVYKHISYGSAIPTYIKKKFHSIIFDEISTIRSLTSIRSEFINYFQNSNTNYNNMDDDIWIMGNILKRKNPNLTFEEIQNAKIKYKDFFIKYNHKKSKHNGNKLWYKYRSKNILDNYAENIMTEFVITFYIKNTDIGLDKFNSYGLAEILIRNFFAPYTEISNGVENEGSFKSFMFGYTIKNSNNQTIIMKKPDKKDIFKTNYIFWYSSYTNLNDINILKTFVHNFIEPLNNEYANICNRLKMLIFDDDSETGLLAPDYEDIPSFDLVFKYLVDNLFSFNEQINLNDKTTQFNLFYQNFNNNKNYETLYQNLIRENIKSNINVIWNTELKTLKEWQNERKNAKLQKKYSNHFTIYSPTNSQYVIEEHPEIEFSQNKIEETKGDLKYKYLKYKQKYLKLKNQMIHKTNHK